MLKAPRSARPDLWKPTPGLRGLRSPLTLTFVGLELPCFLIVLPSIVVDSGARICLGALGGFWKAVIGGWLTPSPLALRVG